MKNLLLQQFRLGFRVFSLFLVVLLVIGCGSGKKGGSIRGKVEYQQKPVTGGRVIFHPSAAGAKEVSTGILPDGTFAVDNVPLGDAKVVIITSELSKMPVMTPQKAPPPKGGGKDAPAGAKIEAPEPPPQTAMPVYVPIPAKYEKPETTPETIKVVKGNQKKDFILTD